MSNYVKRYIANIVIEAISPLKVGSSSIDMIQDAPVQKDWNGLPMVLGTSIAGVLRKEFDEKFSNDIFGDEDSQKKDSKGSRVIFSNALLCNENMKIIESLGLTEEEQNFLVHYENLPIRNHVKITHKGVADTEDKGKYDEEVVYAGSRFKFRVELVANENDQANWEKLLNAINAETFWLGSGTTKGFGNVKVVAEASSYDVFDLNSKEYKEKNSSLNTTFNQKFPTNKAKISHSIYKLKIKPDDFFMFGSGFGDDEVKQTPVKERVVIWNNNKGKFSTEEKILIPASSIKGAIAHRTAFHYNKKRMIKSSDYMPEVAEKNEAVYAIFGYKKEDDNNSKELGRKGMILVSDCFKEKVETSKIFDHVSIDRFTGGGIDSALFNEKTVADDEEWYSFEILLKQDDKVAQEFIIDAFEDSLKDICNGMLPLGGATTKGHGVFTGTWSKS